ncbi:MAG TPA: sensor histidine kinase [Mycobacteriales bacterium]
MSRLRWHPTLIDAALTAALLALGSWELTGALGTKFPGSRAAHAAFMVAGTLPLLARRRYPLLTFITVAVIGTVWVDVMYGLRADQPPFQPYVVMLIIAYSAAAYTDGRGARAAAVVVAVGIASALPLLAYGAPANNVVPPLITLLIAFGVGLAVARYRRSAESSQARNRALEAEQEAAAQRAVAEERARIARELHDVISHDVSLMVLQASVERRAADSDPITAGQTLASIETTGREALAELRRMLGVLRRGERDAPLQPQPGLAQLPELVANARAAGLDITLTVDGDPHPLPPGLDLAAYRILQESLTNAAKHAPGHSVTATVRYTPHDLELTVLDDGARVAGAVLPSGGHGLVGMRERVALYGGSLNVGADPATGGFRVQARIPLPVTT